MQSHKMNLDSGLEADELFGKAAGLAASPGAFYAFGAFVLETLAGREPGNILIACGADTAAAARELSRQTGFKTVPLRNQPRVFNLVGDRVGSRTITVVPLAGPDIRGHLEAYCGFTVEALAVDLASRRPRELIDPLGGLRDLEGGRLRAASPVSFTEDPARLLSGAALAGGYNLDLETETEVWMRDAADLIRELAPRRAWRLIARLFGGRGLSGSARFIQRTGVLGALLPEVEAVRGVPQNYYHHLGVWEHTLAVLDILEAMIDSPALYFPAFAGRIYAHMRRQLEGGVDRRAFAGFAALIHDAGKPDAMSVEPDGRIRFQGHQEIGGRLAASVAARLGLGRRGSGHLAGMVADHMRLGFLIKEGESAESRLRAVDDLGDRCIEVVMLSLADRMATRGEASTEEAMQRFKRLASRVMHDYFWNIDYPPLVGGHDVMMHSGVGPGPAVGRALFKARVAQREAVVSSRGQALEYLAPDFKGRMNMPGD